jgi:uncharacterized membrane protein
MMVEQGTIAADSTAGSATGLEPQFAATLAYLAGPFSGAIILLAERSNRFVRFHAWQSILGLGSLALAALLFLALAFMGLFLSPATFVVFYWLAGITSAVWLVAWGACLVKAFGGAVFKLPVAGDWAARFALRPLATPHA